MSEDRGSAEREPLGVVLAGGAGRRLGGAKAMVALAGEPLIAHAVAAMRAAVGEVAVLAKADTQLPALPAEVAVCRESNALRHPLAGLLAALKLAGGRSVLLCAVDLPLVPAELLQALTEADSGGAPAVVAALGGEMQPLLGCYRPAAAGPLARAWASWGEVPLRRAVGDLAPRLLEVADPRWLFNVNTPEDLLLAEAMLERGRASRR